MKNFTFARIIVLLMLCAIPCIIPSTAGAASAEKINRDAKAALQKLYEKSPKARELGPKATAILVFPSIKKAGFIVGGQFGEGVLLKQGEPAGYYNTISASYGWQAGVQKFGYALFFMSEKMLDYLDKSGGWELGTAPNIVVMEKGAATGISTTTGHADAFAFFFSQKGLMGGVGLQGTKITKVNK